MKDKKNKKKIKKIKKENTDFDIFNVTTPPWLYSKTVKKHFLHPKNFMKPNEEKKVKFNAVGMVGSPACGDVMKFWLLIDEKTERIKKVRWRTFGCGSAIAATSVLSEMLLENNGMTLKEARKIRPQDIVKRLKGLPERKYHCSVLGDKALRDAINDYYRKTKQYDKIEIENGKIIDKVLKITDNDIEKAVLEGAKNLEEVQEKTKVGTGDPKCIKEAEKLIKFYLKKYNLYEKK
ncbi:MAG TPA: iron-sulfur cluster assembly scaffold protein [Candidatus Pacearchaeota archaeon]|nr:iron-sulfur cluster assembly scaffold protein [Candidatus Pacearchaeota archaeon]